MGSRRLKYFAKLATMENDGAAFELDIHRRMLSNDSAKRREPCVYKSKRRVLLKEARGPSIDPIERRLYYTRPVRPRGRERLNDRTNS